MKINNKENSKSPVCCTQPSILFNPKLVQLLYQYKTLYVEGKLVPYRNYYDLSTDEMKRYILMRFTCGLSIDNYMTAYILTPHGDKLPAFYCLPCGKCDLCRTNKANEYAFRATCETNTYPVEPLFVTITYKDKYLPKDGVMVDHMQRFFKRLRANLEETGLPTNFRYLCCGEYGANPMKTRRPHYHIILWNYPPAGENEISKKWSYIFKSWLTYKLDSDGKRVYKYSKKFQKRYPVMESMGTIKILPVTDGCPAYVTKYIRKDGNKPDKYFNEPFLLSSRKNGGIGSIYIRSHADFVYKNRNTQKLELSVYDPYLGKQHTRAVGGYIKQILFKDRSKILKKKTYEKIRSLRSVLDQVLASCAYSENNIFHASIKCIKHILKPLRNFIDYMPIHYYRSNFTYLSHFDEEQLCEFFLPWKNKLLSLLNELDFTEIESANQELFKRKQFMLARSRVQTTQYYHIGSQCDKQDRNYIKYLQRCTF